MELIKYRENKFLCRETLKGQAYSVDMYTIKFYSA